MSTPNLTLADLRAMKKPAVVKVPIVMDGEWALQVNELQEEIAGIERKNVMRSTPDPADVALIESKQEDLRELLEGAEEDGRVVVFRLRPLSGPAYDRLVAAHPPSKKQRDEGAKTNRVYQWNIETFPAALVSAALVWPKLTDAEVKAMWTDADDDEDGEGVWTTGDLNSLYEAAHRAATQRFGIELVDDGEE